MSFIDDERPQVNEVYAKLIQAKKAFKPVLKSRQGHNYKYADLETIFDAIRNALEEQGLLLIQQGEVINGLDYIRTIVVSEHGSEVDFGVTPIKTIKHDAQAFGSGLTYARRYAIGMALGLAPEDDDDGELAGRPMSELEKARLQVIELGKELNQKGYTVEAIKGCLNNVPSQQLTLEEAKEAIGRLNKLLEMEGKA